MGKSVEYKDMTYKTLAECIRQNAVEGLSHACVNSRLKLGWNLEKALTTPVAEKYRRTYTVDGIEYPTLKSLGDAFGLKHDQLYARARRGWSDHEIAYGRSKSKPASNPKQDKPSRWEITVGGMTYPSIKEMCKVNGIKRCTYQARLRAGWTEEEALGIVEREDGQKKPAVRSQPIQLKEIICHGVEYKDSSELAAAYNLPTWKVHQRIAKYGWSPERAVQQGDMRRSSQESVVIRGIEYAHLEAACDALGLNRALVDQRLTKGYSLEEATSEVFYGSRAIEVEGQKFRNLKEAADNYGIDPRTVLGRIAAGHSLESSLEIVPFEPKYNVGRYNEVFFERNPERTNEPALLYFVEILEESSNVAFYKIGITTRSISERFASSAGYLVEEITSLELTLKEAYDLEQMLHDRLEGSEYQPDERFEGRTECYLLSKQQVVDTVRLIDDFKPSDWDSKQNSSE